MAIFEMIAESYDEAHSTMIPFTKLVRGKDGKESGKYSIKHSDVENLFKKKLWTEQSKGGHRKLTSKLTGVVVEYSNHTAIEAGAASSILRQVQIHLNHLFNDILVYPDKRSKEAVPNLKKSVHQYHNWIKS